MLRYPILAAAGIFTNQRTVTTDAAIDQLVYRLYDLSAEEIRVVEGN